MENKGERVKCLRVFYLWQEWQGSNLRPPVLETGALPIELHSCATAAMPLVGAV